MKIKKIFDEIKKKAVSIAKNKNEKVSFISLANEYINQLEEYLFEIIKDRDSILESWEIEVQKRKKLEKENKELSLKIKRYENENTALKILVKEMYQELQRLESNPQIIDYKIKNKEEFIKKIDNYDSDQKLNQMLNKISNESEQLEELYGLREKIKKILNNTKLSKLEPKNQLKIDLKA